MAKILIIDDLDDIRYSLKQLLVQKGFEVKTGGCKEELCGHLFRFQPDLILLDVLLFNDDGRQLCEQVKTTPPFNKIPVILFSANPGMLENYQAYGADNVISKPFKIQELLNKIFYCL